MPRSRLSISVLAGLICMIPLAGAAQTPATPADDLPRIVAEFKILRAQLKAATTDEAKAIQQGLMLNATKELAFAGLRNAALASGEVSKFRSVLTDIERSRLDKQTGAAAGSNGSTTLVERGTAPFLFGLAVESGALTRSDNGNAITFQGRPAGLIKFLDNHDFVEGAVTSKSNLWTQIFNRAAFSVTFDASRGGTDNIFTGDRNQISGWSYHIDFYNRRDSRDDRYRAQWDNLVKTAGTNLANAETDLANMVETSGTIQAWARRIAAQLRDAPDNKLDQTVQDAFDQLTLDILTGKIAMDSDMSTAVRKALDASNAYAIERVKFVDSILKSPTLAVEYSVNRQAPAAVAATASAGTTAVTTTLTSLPDLGTLRVIAAKGIGEGNFTLNATVTNFNNTFRRGRIRDYRVGVQLDAPLAEISDWGKVSLSASGLFLRLVQTPLGEPVKFNDLVVDHPQSILYIQAKMEVPFSKSGLRFPFAVTYASKRELLTDKDKRIGASFGITFDMDKLLAGGL